MPIRWKLFTIVCLLQMLSASFFTIISLISFFQSFRFAIFIRIILFLLILMLSIMAVSIVNNNYPDVPVTGRQKNNFNRLFMLNFIFLIFLFGIIFSGIRQLNFFAGLTGRHAWELPFRLLITPLINFATLIFQLIILYGLYALRRELYINFRTKQFEFEKDQLG
ncbi:MAG TPA: hypothetical protein VI461_05125 [Chitinophagaceae bacterium]|nr:hypothetical protein [Chitinophagaceae bacterium]